MSGNSFLTATHWGVYRAKVENNKIVDMGFFEEDPDPSEIGRGIVDALNAPCRITAPAVRESWLSDGPGSNNHLRGKEAFVEISWQQMEELVAKELTRVREHYGSNSIYAGSYGWASAGRFHHAQSQLKRFLNCSGGFTSSVFTYSFAAAEAMVPHVLGSYRAFLNSSTSWKSIAENGELVVAFGGIPLKNSQIESGGLGAHSQRLGIKEARSAGVEFVNVSPIRTDVMDEVAAEWLAVRPNSDVAVMLGLAHTVYVENLHNQNFLDRYCTGFDVFCDYLIGNIDTIPKDADWAASISDIPADTIRQLARTMSTKRTMISVSWSLTRQHHGEQPFWMAITLAAMLGHIGQPGGGFGFGYSAVNSVGAHHPLLAGGSVPQGKNNVSDFIPVARIADMLLNPGANFTFNGQEYTYPDIKLVWWAGGNPYHHHQDLNRLSLAWQKPDTIICNDWCWNATAKRADIVLPCTTHVEREDVSLSQRDRYVIRMEKAVDPPGKALNDYDIFSNIARRMNIEQQFTEGRTDDEWIRWIYAKTSSSDGKTGDLASTELPTESGQRKVIELPDWEEFCRNGWHRLPAPKAAQVMLRDFVIDPDKNPLSTPSGRIEIFSEYVASFGYDDCPGYPKWLEPYEWIENADLGDLHLITNQPATKLHSQLDQGAVSQAGKINGREPVLINSLDAQEREISNGDIVRLHNKRGACLAVAIVSEDIRPSVLQMSTGAWWDPDEKGMCRHGNPNVLTRDQGTSSLGQGPTAQTCLVKVSRYSKSPPKIEAFDPPEIRSRI